MKNSFPNFILLTTFVILLMSCGGGNEEQKTISKEDSSTGNVDSAQTDEMISMPAPMQIATALSFLKAGYNPQFMVALPSQNTSESTTNKAFRIGMYGVDIGYAIVNNKFNGIDKYIAETIKIAKDLKISGVIEETFIERFKNNTNNRDSLTVLTLSLFNDIHQKLIDGGQEVLAMEILTGSFVEGGVLIGKTYQASNNKEVGDLLAEQKLFTENVLKVIEANDFGQDAIKIKEQLNELKTKYNAITIETQSDSTDSKVAKIKGYNYNQEQLNEIYKIFENLRVLIATS